MRDNSSDYRDIFLNDIPMMDVRAPVEFDKGAFPGVINLPLMNDLEREKVGTCYKQQGQQAAIELGHRLVSGSIKEQRIQAWADFARARPDGLLYCFRGGLRSQLTQQWLKTEAGIDYPRVINGYKAMRTYLIEVTDNAVAECDLVLVGGLTGSGKTEVLAQLDNALDLEGHATIAAPALAGTRPRSRRRSASKTPCPSTSSRSVQKASVSSLSKTRAGRSAAGRYRCRCTCACSGCRWSGWKNASRIASSASSRITWWTCAPSSLRYRASSRALAGLPRICVWGCRASSSAWAASVISDWRRHWTPPCWSRKGLARWTCIGSGSAGCWLSTTTRCTPTNATARRRASSLPVTTRRSSST